MNTNSKLQATPLSRDNKSKSVVKMEVRANLHSDNTEKKKKESNNSESQQKMTLIKNINSDTKSLSPKAAN